MMAISQARNTQQAGRLRNGTVTVHKNGNDLTFTITPNTPTPERPPVPQNAWIEFETNDPTTGERIRHARILGEPPLGTDNQTTNILELSGNTSIDSHTILTLSPYTAQQCSAFNALSAQFDGRPSESFPVKTEQHDQECKKEIIAFDRFFQEIRNAQALIITPQRADNAAPSMTFNVTGLIWNAD